MLEFHVPDMTCGHCVRAITQALLEQDPQAQVSTDLAQHLVRVQTQVPADAVAARLTQVGYPPRKAP
jgi:copper chaperone